VPLVNQTARGIASVSAISAASLRSPLLTSCRICCGAPDDGGGTKNRVPEPKLRTLVLAAGAFVLALALVTAANDPAAREIEMTAAADANRRARARPER
jgi:hypothetical protein